MCVIKLAQPGTDIEPIMQANGEAEFCHEFLTDVAINAADILGEENAGWQVASRLLTHEVRDCLQMHGGIGVTWEHDLHLYLRRVTTDRQLLGTPVDHALHLASLIGICVGRYQGALDRPSTVMRCFAPCERT